MAKGGAPSVASPSDLVSRPYIGGRASSRAAPARRALAHTRGCFCLGARRGKPGSCPLDWLVLVRTSINTYLYTCSGTLGFARDPQRRADQCCMRFSPARVDHHGITPAASLCKLASEGVSSRSLSVSPYRAVRYAIAVVANSVSGYDIFEAPPNPMASTQCSAPTRCRSKFDLCQPIPRLVQTTSNTRQIAASLKPEERRTTDALYRVAQRCAPSVGGKCRLDRARSLW